ncbi:MAG: NAD-binding protein [Candidatus Micrarchaeia archaeon]
MATLSTAEEVPTRLIVLIVAAVIIVLSVSVYYIYEITGNTYIAAYFTLSTLFDYSTITGAAGINLSALTAQQFATVLAVFVVDGVAKAMLVGFVIAAFINALMSIDIRTKMGNIAVRGIRDHVVLCGYSQLAERLCADLGKRNAKFVIIEKSQEKVDLLTDLGYKVIAGDFTKEEVLARAKLASARAVVFASDNEYINLLGIVTAHHLYPELRLIAKAKEEPTITKMHRAGADLCIIPEVLAGLDIGDSIIAKVS